MMRRLVAKATQDVALLTATFVVAGEWLMGQLPRSAQALHLRFERGFHKACRELRQEIR